MCYSLSLPSKLLLHLLDRHARGIAHFVVHVVRLAQSLTRLVNASDALLLFVFVFVFGIKKESQF